MKKNIFKKIVASLATVAMAAGLFAAMPAEEAKAAEGVDNGEYYVVGTMNSWSTSTAIKMTKSGTVYTYEYDIDAAGSVEFKIVENQGSDPKWSDITYVHSNNGGNFTKAAAKAGNVKIKFDTSKLDADKWWDASGAVEISGSAFEGEVVVLDVYTVKGSIPGLDWKEKDNTGVMTEKNGVFSLTLEDIAAGNYAYKVLQDGAHYGWANQYTKESNGAISTADGTIVVAKKSDITISIDKTTKVVTVTVTEVAEDPTQSSQATQSTGETGTKGNTETTTAAADKTTTKAPETTTKKEEAKKGITVEVALSADAKWDKVFIYAFPEGEGLKAWPGVEMTAKDGKWYATLDTTATKLSYVISNGNGEQTVDIKDVEGQNVKITLGAKNAEGKFEASAKAVAAGGTGSAKPGDAAPMVMMFAVAAVAAGMVVASKKKTICE